MKKHSDYVSLWLLLAVALLAVIAYDCGDSLKLGSLEIRQSGIAKALTAQPDSAGDALAATSPEASSAHITFPAPLDTASQRILIIGDSMLEGLNPALGAYAKQNGHQLYSVIWYSSTTEYWGTCDTLRVFLERFKPSFIFVSLGANELFVSNIAQKREDYLKYFLKQIGDIPYVWIGPPNWKPDTGINDMIRRNVPEGAYFKSDGMKFDREKDGAHPTHASAVLWMDSIARWMPAHAAHPIRLDKPQAGVKGRPERVVVLQPKH